MGLKSFLTFINEMAPMTKRQLTSKLKDAGYTLHSNDGPHEKWKNATHTIAVPRHPIVPPGTLRAIMKLI